MPSSFLHEPARGALAFLPEVQVAGGLADTAGCGACAKLPLDLSGSSFFDSPRGRGTAARVGKGSRRGAACDASTRSVSGEGIYDLEEGEAVEVGIARDDAADSVLAHEDRGVQVVQDVAAEVR